MSSRISCVLALCLAGCNTPAPSHVAAAELSGAGAAAPAEILIIRHAEKPDTGPDLNDRGYQRADALPAFFQTNPAVTQFGLPVAVFAAAPKKAGDSLRSIETCTPTATALGLTVDQEYTRTEVKPAAKAILGDAALAGKTVLICWEHDAIPDLARALGWAAAPAAWDGNDVFDRVWVIDYVQGQAVTFRDLPQHLLPGDSDT